MDTPTFIGIIINAALLVVTAGAAIATAVQARVAVAAKAEAESARDETQRLAAEATEAFKRQAAALEKSNELKEAESRPPAWTGPNFISGNLYSMTNSSGRSINVTAFNVQPDEAANLVRISGPDNGVFEYGDSFDLMVLRAMGARPKKLTIVWHYAGEPDDDLNEWIVAL